VTTPGAEPIGVIQSMTLSPGRVKEIAAKIADLEKQGAKRLFWTCAIPRQARRRRGSPSANLFLDKV